MAAPCASAPHWASARWSACACRATEGSSTPKNCRRHCTEETGAPRLRLSEQGETLMATWLLSVHVTEEEHALLEAAAELAGTSVVEFVRRKALEAAQRDLLERQLNTIAPEDWETFEGWAHHPVQEIDDRKDLQAPT